MIREANNPVAERAALRRHEWEVQASQKQPWWQKKRFDAIDVILLVIGIPSLILTILAFI